MTFWQFVWDKTFSQYNSKQKKDEFIIVDHLHYKNKTIEIFLSHSKNINLYELEKLCDTVGWVRRPLKKVKTAIENSLLTISLFYKNDHTHKLIAFARATSDNSFNATIWDVVVHPQFQKKGLGRLLIDEIIKYLRTNDINTVTLFADPQVINFYKRLGFITDPEGIKGMFWYPN
uniref:GCN5-like N-acetyltransferase n=1 Tax=Neogoniolithon spectabile TaxID=231755 RepID=A0A3G3MH64_9FLOR|nr:GCN5-like N-acetyltransferase [Neogoniolithon spectabile]AYR06163.1 GCN5-like N-acetyltransferase [Neogoniolithon spectabile]